MLSIMLAPMVILLDAIFFKDNIIFVTILIIS